MTDANKCKGCYGESLPGEHLFDCPTRIRGLEDRIRELEVENDHLRSRDGNATITIIGPTSENPFARAKLKIADFCVSDNIYVVEQSDRYRELEARIAAKDEALRLIESATGEHWTMDIAREALKK